jgi:ketosteroid isomerase-like protein
MTSQLEDKHAIEELIARYNQSLDGGDYAQWVACWADDAVLDGIGKLLTGKAQIQAFADQYESTTRSRINGLKHYTVNILYTVTGDKATCSSYLQLVSATDKGRGHAVSPQTVLPVHTAIIPHQSPATAHSTGCGELLLRHLQLIPGIQIQSCRCGTVANGSLAFRLETSGAQPPSP